MKNSALLIGCTVLFAMHTHGQTAVQDSLLKQLNRQAEDTGRVGLLLAYVSEIENNEPVKAGRYARAAEALSRKLAYNEGLYNSLTSVAQGYYIRGLFDSALLTFQELLAVSIKMNDRVKIGISNLNIGSAFREKGDFEKALQYSLEGRKVVDNTTDDLLKAKMDDALQILYQYRSEYDKGVIHGERALRAARGFKDEMLLVKCLVNLSMNYISLKRYREAEIMLNESMSIAQRKKDKRVQSAVLMNLADMALKSNDPAKVKKYCTLSLRFNREIGSVDGEALALRAIATAFLMESQFDSANYYARQAYAIDTLHKLRKETIDILNLLSAIYFATGRISEGFDFNQQVNDSLKAFVSEILSQQSAELEKKYDTEKKQSQIKQLQSQTLVQQLSISKKNTLNYIISGTGATILIISLLSYRSYRHRQKMQQQKINTLETEKQLSAVEAVLKGEEQERTRLARDLHDGLGGLLSGIKYSLNTMKENLIMTPDNAQAFERSMDMLDSSIQEMRRVAHNMMPEALVKFGLDTALKDFCTDINKTGAIKLSCQTLGLEGTVIDQTTSVAIYRITQELINNTMKHAAAENAIIQISKNANLCSITVEDDGKGFDTNILHSSKGIGWSNIQSRVEYLKGKMDVQSELGKGTSIHIELNV